MDRANLGRQAVREFEGFTVPDDPRRFTELYNVHRLASSRLDMAGETAAKVHVSTIQRLYSILRGAGDADEGLDEHSPDSSQRASTFWYARDELSHPRSGLVVSTTPDRGGTDGSHPVPAPSRASPCPTLALGGTP